MNIYLNWVRSWADSLELEASCLRVRILEHLRNMGKIGTLTPMKQAPLVEGKKCCLVGAEGNKVETIKHIPAEMLSMGWSLKTNGHGDTRVTGVPSSRSLTMGRCWACWWEEGSLAPGMKVWPRDRMLIWLTRASLQRNNIRFS